MEWLYFMIAILLIPVAVVTILKWLIDEELKLEEIERSWREKPTEITWTYNPATATRDQVKTLKSSVTRMKTALHTANELQASAEVLEMEADEEYKALSQELGQSESRKLGRTPSLSKKSTVKKSQSRKPIILEEESQEEYCD